MYTGTMILDLALAVERAEKRVVEAESQKAPDPVELLIHAQEHLADNPSMDESDREAWRELHWRMNGLITGTGLCQLMFETRHSNDAYVCGKESLTFCADCGYEICLEHAMKVEMETYCLACGRLRRTK